MSGGDKIVLGNAISAPLDENLPTFLEKNYSNVVTALTVSDNRGKILPHIKIGTV